MRGMPHDLRVIAYDTIVAGARRHFLRRATLDMDRLANELAISRATLYRAVDSRDRLLGDVLWSLAERTYAQARRGVSGQGADAIIAIILSGRSPAAQVAERAVCGLLTAT
jgi:hypothetical protein